LNARPQGRAFPRPRRAGRALALALVWGLGCASGPVGALLGRDAEREHERALEGRLAREAAAVSSFAPGAGIVAVPAATPDAGWQTLALIRGQGPSPLSRQLGESFAETRGEARDLVIGGPHAPLAERVLLDAFALSRARALPGLRILWVAPEPPTQTLRAAAAELDVELLYRALPEPAAPQ